MLNIINREDVLIGLDSLPPPPRPPPPRGTIMTSKYGDRQKPQDGIMLPGNKRIIDVNRQARTTDCDRDAATRTAQGQG